MVLSSLIFQNAFYIVVRWQITHGSKQAHDSGHPSPYPPNYILNWHFLLSYSKNTEFSMSINCVGPTLTCWVGSGVATMYRAKEWWENNNGQEHWFHHSMHRRTLTYDAREPCKWVNLGGGGIAHLLDSLEFLAFLLLMENCLSKWSLKANKNKSLHRSVLQKKYLYIQVECMKIMK